MKILLRRLAALCVAFALALLLSGRRFAARIGAVLFIILLPGLAAAADTASIDIQPFLVQYLLPLVFSLLGILALWVLRQLEVRLGIDKNAQLSGKLETAMTNGLALAQSRLGAEIGGGPMMVSVKNQAIAIAAQYALDHVPDTVKSLGVTPELLAQKIEARLTLNTTPSATSIAIPSPDVQAPAAVAVATAPLVPAA